MSELLEVELPRDRGAAHLARQLVAARFGTSLTADELDTVWLLASELVNNALLHGQGQITMKAQVDGRQVRVSAHADPRHTEGVRRLLAQTGTTGRLPQTRASTNAGPRLPQPVAPCLSPNPRSRTAGTAQSGRPPVRTRQASWRRARVSGRERRSRALASAGRASAKGDGVVMNRAAAVSGSHRPI